MYLVWSDPDDWAIFLVEVANLECELAGEDAVVVELIPPCKCGEARTRDAGAGERVEV